MLSKKQRLDLILVERGKTASRSRARALVMAGKVQVNDRIVDKPGILVSPVSKIVISEDDNPYVSRGGLKLEQVLLTHKMNLEGLVCLDIGASTGGFTDCLLQHGAKRVFAVDVGYGQLAWKLRMDPRVEVIERTNVRYMSENALPAPVDLVTIDVSFISLKIVVPAILKFMKQNADILALIKPQFEVGKGQVGKGGVVKDPDQHDAVIAELSLFFRQNDLAVKSVTPSPVLGPKGNKEFFVLLNADRLKNSR